MQFTNVMYLYLIILTFVTSTIIFIVEVLFAVVDAFIIAYFYVGSDDVIFMMITTANDGLAYKSYHKQPIRE